MSPVASTLLGHDLTSPLGQDVNDTRCMGSWIGVCSIGSLLSLNAWLQWLCGYSTFTRTACGLRFFAPDFSNFAKFDPEPAAGHPWDPAGKLDGRSLWPFSR